MKRHRYLWHGRVIFFFAVIIWWLDGSTQSWKHKRHTDGDWYGGKKKEKEKEKKTKKHWLQPHGGWCWHFHPISTAYRHQRKRNFETCLHRRRRGRRRKIKNKKQKKRKKRVSSVFSCFQTNPHSWFCGLQRRTEISPPNRSFISCPPLPHAY